MAAKRQAVSKTDEQAVIPADEMKNLPDYIQQGSGRGSEDVTADDLVIPRLELVQALSPCKKKGDAAYIEGAEDGMLFNSVTRKLYGESVIFVPVLFRKEYLLWRDRKKGGGFGGFYPTLQEANAALAAGRSKFRDIENPDEWEATETAQHFGLVVLNASGDCEEVVISMARTKLKVSRNFNSLVRINGGDRFSRAYVISGVQETNANNEDYYNLSVKNFGFPGESVYRHAENMYEAVMSGERTIEADVSEDDARSAPSEDEVDF